MGNPEIKVGALARLKSGGPLMTVHCVPGDGVVDCQWFEGAELKEARFETESLDIPIGE